MFQARRFKSSLPDQFETKPFARESLQAGIPCQGVKFAQGFFLARNGHGRFSSDALTA